MRNPLNNTITEIKPSGIRKFFDIVSEMKDAISLGVGEPDFETLEALADVFNVSLPSIVGDENGYEMDPHIRIVSGMMENMSEEQKQQIVAIVRAVVDTQKK